MSDGPAQRHGSVTLAIAFSAFQELADPAAVFADAREWSRYVVVVGNDPTAVADALADHGLEQDLALGDDDKWLALTGVRQATDTDRHVLVGTTGDDRRAAEHTGWEFVPLTEAAEKAGWALSGRRADRRGPWRRLRDWLPVG